MAEQQKTSLLSSVLDACMGETMEKEWKKAQEKAKMKREYAAKNQSHGIGDYVASGLKHGFDSGYKGRMDQLNTLDEMDLNKADNDMELEL